MIFFGFFTIQFNSFVCKLVEMLGQLSNIMRIHWIGYLEYNSICLLVGIGTPPPPLPKASVSLPQNQRGWEHSPGSEGGGPNSDEETDTVVL